MSYLDQFLKETSTNQKSQSVHHPQHYDSALVQSLMHHGGSIESEEGDIEDNRALSVTSSKSNLSELSVVSSLKNLFLFK